jgi:hypothetical protein
LSSDALLRHSVICSGRCFRCFRRWIENATLNSPVCFLFFYSKYSEISSTFCLFVVHSTAPTLFSFLHTLEAQSIHISCLLSVAMRLGSYKPTFTLHDRPFEFLLMPLVLLLRASHVDASVVCLSIEDGQPAWSFFTSQTLTRRY